jgi:hypothetical protein
MAGTAIFQHLKPADTAIALLSALLFIMSAVAIYGGPAPARLVVSNDGGEWIYPLSNDRIIEVHGRLGVTVVQIEGGSARIVSSPCANQTCIASAPVARKGDWSACLPNAVFIRAEGDFGESDVDAIVR